MESVTTTPKENVEVTQVVTQREGGALEELLETTKLKHKENLEKVYTEKQPKLVLGQRHDNKTLSGREARLGTEVEITVAVQVDQVVLVAAPGLWSNGGSTTSSKPSSPTARSLSSVGSRPGTVESTGRVARGALDMTRVVGSGSMDWDGPTGGDEDDESSALANPPLPPRAHEQPKILVSGLNPGDAGVHIRRGG